MKKYQLSYSPDDVTWTDVLDSSGNVKTFTANTNRNSPVTNTLTPPVAARFVRLHPVVLKGRKAAMRWDLSGFIGQYINL